MTNTYSDFAQVYHDVQSRGRNRAMAEWIIRHGKIDSSTVVFEGGCGSGLITQYLLEHTNSVIAVDQSQAMLDIGKQRLPHFQGFSQGDLTAIDIPKHRVAVFCSDVFHYFKGEQEVFTCLKKVFDAMEEGGTLVFDTLHPRELAHRAKAKPIIYRMKNYTLTWKTRKKDKDSYCYHLKILWKQKTPEIVQEQHIIRTIRRRHMNRILSNIGFAQVQIFNDYTDEMSSKHTRRYTWIARKLRGPVGFDNKNQ